MKVSFAIPVCTELHEIKRLVSFLIKNKRIEDEIVILFDEKNGNVEILSELKKYTQLNNFKIVSSNEWNDNFADWKNKLNSYCTGDWIFQLDADEMIDEYLIKNIESIIQENSNVDLIFVPRINTVNNITKDDIKNWNWTINDKGWINFPDIQPRIYKKNMYWYGKVHERIIGKLIGAKNIILPLEEIFCIQHHKTIERQRKQIDFYIKLEYYDKTTSKK